MGFHPGEGGDHSQTEGPRARGETTTDSWATEGLRARGARYNNISFLGNFIEDEDAEN